MFERYALHRKYAAIVATGVEIVFYKGEGTRYRSILHRSDCVLVELDGGGWNKIVGRPGRIPHDIAHLIVESELGLTRGLWGVLAAGGIVQNARVISGRQPPRAAERAEAIVAPARESLRQAEILVRAIADLSIAGASADVAEFDRHTGARWKTDATREQLTRASLRLEDLAREWDELGAGETLGLVSPNY